MKTWEGEGRGVPPLSALASFLAGQSPEEVRRQLLESPVPEVVMRARGTMAAMESVEKLKGSVWTELAGRFECLDDPRIRAVTSSHEIDIPCMGSRPTALYIPLYLEQGQLLRPVLAWFFTNFFRTLMAEATRMGGSLAVPVMCYLDEFGVLGRVPDYAGRMATMRSYGIGCFMVVQSLSQLRASYGREEAEAITSNATIKVALPGIESEDAQYFSRLAGETTVISEGQVGHRDTMSVFQNSANRSRVEAKRSLITPDELKRLDGEAVISYRNQRPIRAKLVPYWEVKHLRARAWDGRSKDPLEEMVREEPLPDPGLSGVGMASTGERAEASQRSPEPPGPKQPERPVVEGLGAKHLEVLELIGRGLNSRQMAQALGVGQQTVVNLCTTIYTRLGVEARGEEGRREAYERARQLGPVRGRGWRLGGAGQLVPEEEEYELMGR